MGEFDWRDVHYARRTLPLWLFSAIARALLRAINAVPGDGATRRQIADHFPQEIRRNHNAAVVMLARLTPRQAYDVAFRVAEILRYARIIVDASGRRIQLGSNQLATSRPASLANRFVEALHQDYVSAAAAEPRRYKPLLPQTVELFPAYEHEPRIMEAAVPTEPVPPARRMGASVAIQRVYYATDRVRAGVARFANRRADLHLPLSLGSVDVSIPHRHRPGRLEQPWGFLGLRFERESIERHFFIADRHEVDDEWEFIEELSRSRPAAALLYVHGYWSRFDGAMKVAAQIAYDLRFKGPVVAFSWASRGMLPGYMADEAAIEIAVHHCELALQLLERSGITRVYVLAHSMGGRILSDVLHERYLTKSDHRLEAAVFAAPDIDAQAFHLKSRSYRGAANAVTLYASTNDKAMGLSRALHAAPRAGDARPIVICPGVESVDASAVDTNWLSVGHGYHNTPELLEDVGAIVDGEPLPRNLERIAADPRGIYHAFRRRALPQDPPEVGQ